MGYDILLKQKELKRKSFHEAAIREAEKLSGLLRKNFQFETLYLFGSAVKGKNFGFHSDIDFVIKGLPKDHFLKALALLIKNSQFRIDLKPWEELSSEMRAQVEKEGRTLL